MRRASGEKSLAVELLEDEVKGRIRDWTLERLAERVAAASSAFSGLPGLVSFGTKAIGIYETLDCFLSFKALNPGEMAMVLGVSQAEYERSNEEFKRVLEVRAIDRKISDINEIIENIDAQVSGRSISAGPSFLAPRMPLTSGLEGLKVPFTETKRRLEIKKCRLTGRSEAAFSDHAFSRGRK
jgi:hypothetical protein